MFELDVTRRSLGCAAASNSGMNCSVRDFVAASGSLTASGATVFCSATAGLCGCSSLSFFCREKEISEWNGLFAERRRQPMETHLERVVQFGELGERVQPEQQHREQHFVVEQIERRLLDHDAGAADEGVDQLQQRFLSQHRAWKPSRQNTKFGNY